MTSRPIFVFALTTMLSVAGFADSGVRPVKQHRGSSVAERHAPRPGAVNKAGSPEQRQARRAHRAANSQKSQDQSTNRRARRHESSRPKDYSRDFQVPPGPDQSIGTTVVLSESFDTSIPAGWTVVDNAGSGVVWTNLAGCGESANWTDGSGDLACVSSDIFGPAEFDTELQTPVIDLSSFPGPVTASLTFNTNYQNWLNRDFFEVDVSTNGAAGPWTNLLSWNEDHGGYRALPGEAVNLDIASVVGEANVMFRFHYFDPISGDWDWYAQVDDVVVQVYELSVIEIPAASNYSLAGLALLLVGAGFVALRRQH